LQCAPFLLCDSDAVVVVALDVSELVSSEPSSSSSESSSVSDSGPLLQCCTGAGGGGGGAELCFWLLSVEQVGGGTLPFLIALAEGFLSFPFPTQ